MNSETSTERKKRLAEQAKISTREVGPGTGKDLLGDLEKSIESLRAFRVALEACPL